MERLQRPVAVALLVGQVWLSFDRIRCGAGGEAAERETPKSGALSAL